LQLHRTPPTRHQAKLTREVVHTNSLRLTRTLRMQPFRLTQLLAAPNHYCDIFSSCCCDNWFPR